jgi:predicted DNA-binding protein (MmcQ/YjbR family)
MNIDEIRQACMSFPGATEKLQWGDAVCFKIGGKMFVVLGLDNPRLSFKCTPEAFAELIERENIRPSPYLGRHNWVMLERLDAVGNQELRGLMRQSYELVKAKAKPTTKTAVPGRRGKAGSSRTRRRLIS